MAEKKKPTDIKPALRSRAEKMLTQRGELDKIQPADVRRMLHELEVHQIELELQNNELRRAQEELEASRQKYFDLCDRAAQGYVTLNEKGIILENNLTVAALFGKERSDLVGQPLIGFIFGEDQDIYYFHKNRLFETRAPQECEVRMSKGDGLVFWARLESVVVSDNDGALALRMMISDITKRKLAEEALRESEQRERERAEELAVMLEAIPTPVIIVHDADARHMTGNRAADDLTRVPSGGEISLSAPATVKPAHFKAVKDGRELRLDELPAQRAARGETVKDFEFDLIFADGMVRHLLGYGTPLLDKQRRPRGAVHTLVDITERKRTEESLRASEERLALAASATKIGMFDWDLTKRSVLWTETHDAIFGYIPATTTTTTTEHDYRRWADRVHPDDLSLVEEETRRCMQDRKPLEVQYRIIWPDGSLHWVETKGVFLYDCDGQANRMLGVVTDISERKRAEEVLASVHRQIQSIIDNTTSLIYAVDLEERFLLANTAVAELLNSTPEQMTGKRRHEFMPKGDADGHEANDCKVMETGRALEFEEHSQLRGRSITWLTTKFPLRDAQGKIYAVGGISADISELKRIQEALRQSQETFSALVERSPFGTYIVDSQFRIAQMNASSQTVAFRNVRPVIGRPFDEAMRILWPEDVAVEIIGRFRHTLETGEPYFSRDFIRPRHDSGIVEAYEWELHRMTLPDGQYGVICYYYDSTKLREAEAALRESEERLRYHVENSPLAVVECDPEFVVIRWAGEAEKIFGWSAAETVGKPIMDLRMIFEEDMRIVQKTMEKLTDGNSRHVVLTNRNYTKDGRMIHCTWYNTVLYDAAGRMKSIMSQCLDITERKRAEEEIKKLNDDLFARNEQLEFANKELESFIYSVSHDLRAPLRHISGFADLLMKNTAEKLDEKEKRYLSNISKGSEKMSGLIDDLLNLSRISRQEIHRGEVKVSEMAASIVAELREAHPDRSVEVAIKDGLTAFADRGLTEVVLSNLLRNAWKFTSKTERASIELGTMEEDGKIIYYILDNGVGFDQKYAERMFWPFHRLHSETAFEGTGIGLAIVDRIIRSHGGKVWAEGTPGKGATIYFSLS